MNSKELDDLYKLAEKNPDAAMQKLREEFPNLFPCSQWILRKHLRAKGLSRKKPKTLSRREMGKRSRKHR